MAPVYGWSRRLCVPWVTNSSPGRISFTGSWGTSELASFTSLRGLTPLSTRQSSQLSAHLERTLDPPPPSTSGTPPIPLSIVRSTCSISRRCRRWSSFFQSACPLQRADGKRSQTCHLSLSKFVPKPASENSQLRLSARLLRSFRPLRSPTLLGGGDDCPFASRREPQI